MMATTVVYVSCAEPREILRFAMDRDSAELRRIDATYVPGIDIASNTSMPLAVSPNKRVLHAGLRQPPYPCVGFAIDPADGALSVLGCANLPHSVCYLTIDRTGKHLLAASYQGALLASHKLDATIGVFAVAPETGLLERRQILRTHPEGFAAKAADMHLTPDGSLLYASERSTSTLTACCIAPDGALTVIGQTATETFPRGFAIDPRGRFLLAVGQESHHLSVYRIDPQAGRLDAVARYATARNPNWVEIVDLPGG